MLRRRGHLLVLTAAGLLIVGLGTIALGASPSKAIATNAGTPGATPSFFPPGIRVEYLASSPLTPPIIATPEGTGPTTSTQTNVNLMRITYAPGAALDIHWPGPVTCYVDQGALTVQIPASGQVGIGSGGQGPGPYSQNTSFSPHEPNTIPAGRWIFAYDGYVGATRNDGTTPTVVLVVTVITQQLTGFHHHESVTVPLSPGTPAP